MSTVDIFFDGGCVPNPGTGYGSYLVRGEGLNHLVSRIPFGTGCTCNTAEYMALISAIKFARHHVDPEQHRLQIWTDSVLVREQLSGRWRVKVLHIKELWKECRAILSGYEWRIDWHARKNNVELFGH